MAASAMSNKEVNHVVVMGREGASIVMFAPVKKCKRMHQGLSTATPANYDGMRTADSCEVLLFAMPGRVLVGVVGGGGRAQSWRYSHRIQSCIVGPVRYSCAKPINDPPWSLCQ